MIHQIEQSILIRTLQNKVWMIRPEWIPIIHDIVLSHFFDRENKAQRIMEAETTLGRKLDNSAPLNPDIRDIEGIKVLVLPVHGVMDKRMNMFSDISGGVSTQKLQSDINSALADSGIDAIVLDVESPGGGVDFTKETADFIYEAGKVKPIVAFANGEMASGAYYIGSAASKVLAYDSAFIGSIGVYIQQIDISKQLEQDGVKVHYIRSTPLKGTPNRYESMTKQTEGYLQGLVAETGKMFVNDIAHYRDVPVATVENEWHKGAMFTAQDALKMGMIDEIVTSLDDAVRIAASMVDKKGGGMTTMSSIEMEAFTHNSKTVDTEPSWGSIDKTKLPRTAFADMGETDKKSTWGYPHHWVQGGSNLDKDGVYTDGVMYLHRGGLNAAWAAANGARSGVQASPAVKAHLQAHRKALGLDTAKSEQENIGLLGEQYEAYPNGTGGDEMDKIAFSERIKLAVKVLRDGDTDAGKEASDVLAQVQGEVTRLETENKDLQGKVTTAEGISNKYIAIPEDIRTKIEDSSLTWDTVEDYVKVCQKELDSVCTDLCDAAVAAKGNEAKVEDLKTEILTKSRAFGLEAAIDHGRKMIKAFQDGQKVKPGQKTDATASDDDDPEVIKARENDILVKKAKDVLAEIYGTK